MISITGWKLDESYVVFFYEYKEVASLPSLGPTDIGGWRAWTAFEGLHCESSQVCWSKKFMSRLSMESKIITTSGILPLARPKTKPPKLMLQRAAE